MSIIDNGLAMLQIVYDEKEAPGSTEGRSLVVWDSNLSVSVSVYCWHHHEGQDEGQQDYRGCLLWTSSEVPGARHQYPDGEEEGINQQDHY